MAIIDPNKPFEVEIDMSDFVFGGQLVQQDEERRLYPIAFFSKKLYRLEFNYFIYNKELIVIIESFKEWKPYLNGTKHWVKVYTDHKNFIYFTTSKDLNQRQMRSIGDPTTLKKEKNKTFNQS